MMQSLRLENVHIWLDDDELVRVDAQVAPGEILTVMGPSGSGKSTLLAYLAGFLDPAFRASGQVFLNGDNVTATAAEERRMGLLFQDPLLFPHLSVGGNLAFALPPGTKHRAARVNEALGAAGLDGFANRDTATLSGGQKARVALLRVLLSNPRAVLLDEPFSKLDSHLRGEIRMLVFDRLRQAGLPAVLVTHDIADAEAANGPVVRLP